jgi:hypothetical protein
VDDSIHVVPLASPDHLLAVAQRRVAAVQSGDVDAVMAALVDEPVLDFLPLGLRLSGHQDVRRYYGHFLNEVIPRSSGRLVATFIGQAEVAFEFITAVTDGTGGIESFRILAVQPVDGDRVAGERLYASDRYARLIVGDELWHLLMPIPADTLEP